MSFGKIVRKIVKKWLKKDNETGLIEPHEYELYAEQPIQLGCEPCMFCVERDGACGGDLNRNIHISDEMGFSRDDGGIDYSKCIGDDMECGLYDTSPLHVTTSIVGDSSELSLDSASHSSRSPVPVCVCEACYIFVSSHLPSTIAVSSSSSSPPRRDAVTAAGQPLAHSCSGFFPQQCPNNEGESKLVLGKFVKRRSASKEVEPTECNKDSSISLTSSRRIHSAESNANDGCNMAQQQLETTSHGPVNLPVSVHVSFDGEEGFWESQRRLRIRNRWHDPTAHVHFRPPPNKTICHVAK